MSRTDIDRDFTGAFPIARSVALTDWDVTWVMAAGTSRREFRLRVPATDERGARDAAYRMGLAINEGSGYIWKITEQVTATEVGAGADLAVHTQLATAVTQ